MPIEVHCPECQALLRIADENAGRQSRCPSCSTVFTPSDVLASPAESTPPTLPPTVAPMGRPTGIDAANPYAPSSTSPETRREGSSEWAPTRFNVEEVFSTTWAIFKVHWLIASGAVVIVQVVNFGVGMMQNVGLSLAQAANDPAIAIPATVLIFLATGLFQTWLQIGQIMVMFDIARGREIKLSKLFAGGPYLVNTVLAVLMASLIVGAVALVMIGIPAAVVFLATQNGDAAAMTAMISFAVAVVPLVILSLMFSQIQMLIIDRGLGPVASLHTSYDITNGNKFTIFVIGILLFLILIGAFIVGLLALCIGVLPAMIGFSAFSSLILVVTYLTMTGQRVGVPQPYVATGPVV